MFGWVVGVSLVFQLVSIVYSRVSILLYTAHNNIRMSKRRPVSSSSDPDPDPDSIIPHFPSFSGNERVVASAAVNVIVIIPQ